MRTWGSSRISRKIIPASWELPLPLQKVVTVRLVKNRPINLWSTLGAVFIFSFNIASAQSITITEFALPTVTFPYSITPGPDAALWFTESDCPGNLVCSGKIGRITTAGAVTEYPLAEGPSFITAGPDGALWYTEGPGANIGRITTSGVITEYPDPTFRGVSGTGITAGPDGALWFPLYFENMIGRMTTAGVFTGYAIPTALSGPIGIATGPDGALWFVESGYVQGGGQGVGKIGRVTTAGVITEYPLPTATSPYSITPGPDGALWFTEASGNKIGRITTAGVITEYPLPTATSPYSITPGPDAALWFTEIYCPANVCSGKIGRITTAGVITEYPLPTAGSAPLGITAGPDGALWFTEPGSAKVGRVGIETSPFTTYTYHGNPYNVCGGTYCTGGPYALSVEFTTALGGENGTTYSYQSPTFTGFIGNTGLSTSSFVSASVTYNNALAPNLNDCKGSSSGCTTTGNFLADVPSNWVFSDGVTQWTPANSHFYVAVVDTNASGNIVGWDFTLYTNPAFTDPEIYTISCAGNLGCDEVVLSDTSLGANTNIYAYGPGSQTAWTQTAKSGLANLPYTDITGSIVSFTFTDGSGLTDNNNNSSYKDFAISTNASGNIVTWFVTSCGSSCNIQMQTNWDSPVGFIPGADFSETTASFAGSYGFISGDPGTWSASPLAAFSAAQVAITASGLSYSRVTKTYNGTVTITNISGGALGGPFPIVFTSLTPGVTLANATGTVQGGPYINPSVSSLGPGQSVTLPVQFSNPSNALINFTPVVY